MEIFSVCRNSEGNPFSDDSMSVARRNSETEFTGFKGLQDEVSGVSKASPAQIRDQRTGENPQKGSRRDESQGNPILKIL